MELSTSLEIFPLFFLLCPFLICECDETNVSKTYSYSNFNSAEYRFFSLQTTAHIITLIYTFADKKPSHKNGKIKKKNVNIAFVLGENNGVSSPSNFVHKVVSRPTDRRFSNFPISRLFVVSADLQKLPQKLLSTVDIYYRKKLILNLDIIIEFGN